MRALTVRGTNGAHLTVTPGRLDQAAKKAFTHGQCHAFARALSEVTGWALAVLIDETCCLDPDSCDDEMFGPVCSCQFEHVVAVTPDGRHVDITGEYEPGHVPGCEGLKDIPLADEIWEYLADSSFWNPPALDVARTLVAPFLATLINTTPPTLAI